MSNDTIDFDMGKRRAKVSLDACRGKLIKLSSEGDENELLVLWLEFLKHYTDCVSAMKKATNFGAKKNWSDRLIFAQKDDKILNYLFQARNADEHGLELISEPKPASVKIGNFVQLVDCVDACVTVSSGLNVFSDSKFSGDKFNGVITTTGDQYKGIWTGSLSPEGVPRSLALKPVVNRGVTYDVPHVEHENKEKYIVFAEYTLAWLERKISELN